MTEQEKNKLEEEPPVPSDDNAAGAGGSEPAEADGDDEVAATEEKDTTPVDDKTAGKDESGDDDGDTAPAGKPTDEDKDDISARDEEPEESEDDKGGDEKEEPAKSEKEQEAAVVVKDQQKGKEKSDGKDEDTKSEHEQRESPEPKEEPKATSTGGDEESVPAWARDEKDEEEIEVKFSDEGPIVGVGDIEEAKKSDAKKSDAKKSDAKKSERKSATAAAPPKKDPSDWAKEDGSDVDAAAEEVVPLAPPVPVKSEGFSDGHGGINVAGIHISTMRLPLVCMFASATVLLISVLVYKGAIRWRDYAIAVPSATMILSFLLFLATFNEDFYTKYGKIPNQITFLWNFVGACFLTFGSPFDTTGNGYFASWLSVIFSAAALGFTATAFQSTVRGMGALMGLFCSAVIVVVAIVEWLGKDSFYRFEAIYAICVAIVTMILVLAHVVRQKMTGGQASGGCEGIVAFVVLCLFAALWVALAGVCTFRGPFLTTGNGYFSSWTGAACACFAAFASWRKSEPAAPAPPEGEGEEGKEVALEDWAKEDDSPV